MRGETGIPGASELREWFETPVSPVIRPALVGGLAAGEIGLRSTSRLSRWAIDSDVLPALGSLVLGGVVGPDDAAAVIIAALYGYLIYVFTPTVFPNHVEHVTTRRGFRILTAINAVQFPVVAFGPLSSLYRYLSLVGWSLLLVYVVAVQGRSLFSREGYPVAFMNAFTPTNDIQAEYDTDPVIQKRGRGFWITLGFLTVTSFVLSLFVVTVLGFVLGLLNFMYPVPEFAMLGWVGYQSVLNGRVGPNEAPSRRIDIEATIVATTGVATQGLKGVFSVLVAVLGLTVPVIFLLISVAIAAQAGDTLAETAQATNAQLLAAGVGLLTILTFTAYSVWYWLRLFSRLPHFLTAWRAQLPKEIPVEYADTDHQLLARPPGWFVPPVLFLLTMGHMQRYGSWPEVPVIPLPHLLVWTALLGVIAWTTYRGVVGQPQSPETDAIALPASFLSEMAGAFLWVDIGTDSLFLRTVFGRLTPSRLAAALWEPTTFGLLLFVVGIAYLFFLPDIHYRVEATAEGEIRYVPYFLPLVLGPVLAYVRTDGVLSYLALVVAGLFVLMATVVLLEGLGLVED